MKKTPFAFLLACIACFSCSKKDDDGSTALPPNDLHVKLNIVGNYLADNQQGWAFLSDPDGNVLTCQPLQNGTVIDLQNEVPFFGSDYHLTLAIKTFTPSDEGGYPDNENMSFETFAFIQKDSLALVVKEPEQFPFDYPKAKIKLNVNEGMLENFVASSTLTANKGTEWAGPHFVGMKRNAGDVYLIVKMQGEAGWRHVFFEEVPAGTMLEASTSSMAQIPASTVQVPEEYASDLHILGIRTCGSGEFLSLQWYVSGENGSIPARYSEGIFDKYRSEVTLTKDKEEFQFVQLGEPLSEYFPTPLGFSVDDGSVQDFKLPHDGDFTVFEADWAHDVPGTDVYKTANWKVWSAFPATFKAPQLPNCITEEIDWLQTADFDLKSVKNKRFSSFTGFTAYLDYYLQHLRDPFGCDQHSFNGSGTFETKTKYFD